MLKNFLKTAFRNLLKNKTFSAINILGLAIGIAAFLLIVNYLRFEYSYDTFHKNADRIYRVPMTIAEKDGKLQTFAFTYPAVAPALKKDFPEIEEVVRFRKTWGVVSHGDKKVIENGRIFYVDPSVFSIFSFAFEKGSPATAFTQLNDVVVTQATAKKYFGEENAIGQRLHYNNEDFVVTAVLKDVPSNSHLQFNILLNYNKYIQTTNGAANTSWGWSDFYTYCLLKKGTTVAALESKLPAFAQRYTGDDMKKEGFIGAFQLQPLKSIHTNSSYDYELDGNGNFYYLKYLGIAALFILFIALINYVNLSTARSLERAKEVGVRKVIGATRTQLIQQFLSESFLVNLFGIAIGFFIFKISLLAFSGLLGLNVTDLQTSATGFWLMMAVIFLLSTLLAGFYPAFVLSSFQPVKTLKSMATFTGGKNLLRKTLVVTQFCAALILISGSIGFYRQLKFMSNRDLGINIKQTLVLQQTINLDSSSTNTVDAVINNLKQIAGVEAVATSTDVPGNEVGSSSGFVVVGRNDDKRCRTFGIDNKFIPQYSLSLLAGRNFDNDKTVGTDTSQPVNIIINETASKIFGFKKPADALTRLIDGGGFHCKVIGVLSDYHQQSLQFNFDPIIFYPDKPLNMTNFSLKLQSDNSVAILEKAKTVWSAAFPQSPLQFFFLDEYFNRQYKTDNLFATVLGLFTLLAIIVASLGLFGLSLYTVTKRAKEISIRKVLGANVLQLIQLITKEYIKLILIAGCLAIPVAYFIVKGWMDDYAFHINPGIAFFILPMVLIIGIALITVLYQCIKVAVGNPVKSLRTE
ncbi:MAG: ABC transporter permease [Chitinophagaceae bacterium]